LVGGVITHTGDTEITAGGTADGFTHTVTGCWIAEAGKTVLLSAVFREAARIGAVATGLIESIDVTEIAWDRGVCAAGGRIASVGGARIGVVAIGRRIEAAVVRVTRIVGAEISIGAAGGDIGMSAAGGGIASGTLAEISVIAWILIVET